MSESDQYQDQFNMLVKRIMNNSSMALAIQEELSVQTGALEFSNDQLNTRILITRATGNNKLTELEEKNAELLVELAKSSLFRFTFGKLFNASLFLVLVANVIVELM